MQNRHSLEITIDRIEDTEAVFILNNKEYALPKNIFPKNIKEGEVALVEISLAKEETAKKEKKAKELLNEILNGSEER